MEVPNGDLFNQAQAASAAEPQGAGGTADRPTSAGSQKPSSTPPQSKRSRRSKEPAALQPPTVPPTSSQEHHQRVEITPKIRRWIGDPPSRDPSEQVLAEALLQDLAEALRPGDNALQWFRVRDMVDAEVGYRGLKRVKATLPAMNRAEAARNIVEPGYDYARRAPLRYLQGVPLPTAVQEADERIAARTLPVPYANEFRETPDHVVRLAQHQLAGEGLGDEGFEAQSYISNMEEFERIERMLAHFRREREQAIASFERAAEREAVRTVVDYVDAEFE